MNYIKKLWKNYKLIKKYPFLRSKFFIQINWLSKLINMYDEKAFYIVRILGKPLESNDNYYPSSVDKDNMLFTVGNNNRIKVITPNDSFTTINVSKMLWKPNFKLLGIHHVEVIGRNIFITLSIQTDNEHNYGFQTKSVEIVKNKFYKKCYDILSSIYNFLDKYYIIPEYTRFESIPKGWRDAFGLQMCEEIKQALLEHGGEKELNDYQVLQIKEKFGELRWYDGCAPKKVHDIISKYEDISRKTCISCGKPAKYITTGWICPYCEDCVPTNSKYIEINEEY